jgi:IS5 family transposase
MLRIHLMQQWYSLNDPAMEDALIEVPVMRRFAGIDLMSERIPDETTILAFRHLLEKHDLGQKIFEAVKPHLKSRGMAMKQGTIIDATLIAAPTSTKNKQGERDPEMHQTMKGNQSYHRCAEGCAYGMKAHIGVDAESSDELYLIILKKLLVQLDSSTYFCVASPWHERSRVPRLLALRACHKICIQNPTN